MSYAYAHAYAASAAGIYAVTTWKFAMILTLFVCLAAPENRRERVRVWAAMMVGSLLGIFYQSVWFFLALDILVAVAIMAPPKWVWQRVIGFCYVAMVLLSTGYMLRELAVVHFSLSPTNSPDMLKSAHDFLGWAALAALLSWGAHGILGTYWARFSGAGSLAPARSGRVR